MGITSESIKLIEKARSIKNIMNVIELGAQNLYNTKQDYGLYADVYYKRYGIYYECIDLNGENGAYKTDLSLPRLELYKYSGIGYDLVSDFGTSEHIGDNGKFAWKAIYNCWKTKFDLLKIGGIMINENPKTDNWVGHGFNYYTQEFYNELALVSGLSIIEIGEIAAMGNTIDGWNIYCIMEKINDNFPTLSQFKKLSLKQS